MKKNYLLLLSLFGSLVFAQTTERNRMIAREASSAAKMAGFNTNPNTENYDLKYQRLDLTLDPASYFVSGTVTSHFVPNKSMSSIYFDLSNVLTVSKVSYHGSDLPFQQLSTKELKIDFPAALAASVKDSLSVTYSGAPDNTNQAFTTSTQGGVPVLFTLSEPYGAQDWFPTKQSMSDKIDQVDFKITSPNQYSVAANGRLMSETELGSGKRLTFWRTQYPTAAYLVALGITNYVRNNSTIGTSNFPYVNYLYPSSNTASNLSNIDWLKKAMSTFEQYFGAYPFKNEKYGHMQFGWGGGMEHQTMTSTNSFSQTLLAHELMHQWFGDKITCGAWNDVWLNEGFATYGEHLVNEKLLLSSAGFLSFLRGQISTITSSAGGSVYVSDANLNNDSALFSSRLSYAKGGYVVRMIRWVLGDDAFYSAIRDYLNRPDLAYGYARTADLRASLLASTGKDFTEFFNDWVYGQGYPTYQIRWNQQADKSVNFVVGQTQSHSSVSFFEMPLPVRVTGTNGEVANLVLNNNTNNQRFSMPVNFTVSSVSFNPDLQILEKNSTVTKDATLAISETAETQLKIYPNPVHSDLNFSGLKKSTDFVILNTEGRIVAKGTATAGTPVNVSGLQNGMYILKMEQQNFKFLKN